MTPQQLIRETAAAFQHSGVPDPVFDAAALLSFLTSRNPLELRMDRDTQLDEDTLSGYQALVSRRLSREPLQYILGTAWFLGYPFYVDRRVLIPRPETEALAELAVSLCPKNGAVLDLCTGSGCIGISVAIRTSAHVTLSDLSTDALDVARRNAAALCANVELVQSDLFDKLDGLTYDMIVSNPPYIPRCDCETLQAEVMQEPHIALDGGPDGLDIYRKIAAAAPAHLKKGGKLLLEIGDTQARAVSSLLEENGFTCQTITDFRDHDRIIRGVLNHA